MKYCIAFFCVLLLSSISWADDPKPGDFAGAMVYSGREGSLLALEIPEEVYQGLRRPDLGDIRIFDTSDSPVPFIIRERPKEYFTPLPEEVPFFIWDGGRESSFPSNTDIEINTSGSVVRIKNQNVLTANLRFESPPVYLVDLSSLKYRPSTLRVKTDHEGNFNTAVSIHYSGDLSAWRTFDDKQVLASFGGNLRDTLDLPETSEARYLLVGLSRGAPSPLSMTVSFNPMEHPETYHEVAVKGRKSPDGKKISYETSAFYPAESVDFILPEADSIPVVIKSRFSEKEEWNIIGRGTIFRYNTQSGIEKNPPFDVATRGIDSRAPLWELETTGALPFNSIPDLLIRWKPRELIFPARGQGPWTLAYGNPACPPLGTAEILPIGRDTELEPAVFTREKRYEAISLPVQKERDYKVIILWIFLGTAVVILSILAYTIAKSMRKQ